MSASLAGDEAIPNPSDDDPAEAGSDAELEADSLDDTDDEHDEEERTAEHDALLLRVAERYYFGRESMVAISKDLGISRFRVARLLDEAERRGAVRITLHRPRENRRDLAARLRAHYGLRHAVVIDSGRLPESQLREELGKEGARLLAGLLADGDVLGVGWGRAVEAVADAAGALPRCAVVQLSGITGQPSNNSVELVRRFSALTREAAYPMYVPLLVPDATTATTLRESHGIAETFARFKEVSVALVAIGSWDPPNSLLRSFISPKVRELLTEARLSAEVGGIFLDADGTEIDTPLDGRIMSISAQELADIPTVMAVAGHASKAGAIRAVLRAGLVNALVTDSSVARILLES